MTSLFHSFDLSDLHFKHTLNSEQTMKYFSEAVSNFDLVFYHIIEFAGFNIGCSISLEKPLCSTSIETFGMTDINLYISKYK